jgi:cupin fold WbuC family metalloprotein
MFLNVLDADVVKMVREKARTSPRLRANHCFHLPEERLQRMVNIALRDSYFAPHRHEAEGKIEIFTVISGKVLIALFDDEGDIVDKIVLEAGVGPWQAEIPPNTWHTLAVVSKDAVMYEVIDGHYDPATHKRFASWAPPESDHARGLAWLDSLRNRCGVGVTF